LNEAAVGNARLFQAEEAKLRNGAEWVALVQLYEARAERVDPASKERLLYKAGEVASDQLADSALAERLFLTAFKERKSFLPAIGALKVLHTNNSNDDGLLQVLDYELDITSDGRRRGQLLYEKGELLKKTSPELAIDAYGEAIQAYPKSRLPLDTLEALAKQLGQPRKLVKAYRDLAKAAKPEQAAVYHFLGGMTLSDSCKDLEGAAFAFRASLDTGAAKAKIMSAISKHFEKHADWEGFTKVLWLRLEAAQEPKERARLLKKQAWAHETHLGQAERAQRLLQKALEANPKDPGAIRELQRLSKSLGDARALAEALEAEAELPTLSDKDKADRLERAAEQRDKARDGKKAFQDVKKALILRPRSPRGLKLLEVITRKLGNWPEHARALEQELELLQVDRSPKERAAALKLLRRLAELCETKLKDDARLRKVLERLVELAPEDDAAWGELDGLVRQAEDWAGACELLVKRIAASPEDERPARMRELAILQREKLGDLEAAAETLEVLTQLRGDDADSLALLCDVYEDAGKRELLIGTLAQLAAAERDGPAKAEPLRRMAKAQLAAGQTGEARAALLEALGHEPDGPGALEGFRALVEVAEALADDALLRQGLGGLRREETDPAALRTARIKQAQVDERAGDLAGALAVLEEILAEDPGDEQALPVAVRLLCGADRQRAAVERLEAAAQALDHAPARAAACLGQMSALLEEPLGDLDRAREAAGAAVHQHADADTYARFARLARAADRGAELRDVVLAVADRVEDPALRLRMWREGAAEAQSSEPAKAVELLERVLADRPGDPAACLALRGLYRQLERWGELAGLLEEAASSGVAGLEAKSCWRELAKIADEQLGDLPRAAQALETLLAEERGAKDPGWPALVGLYERLERHRDLVRVHERVAELITDPVPRAERLAEAARVYEERLLDHGAAARALEAALEATPDEAKLLLGLGRVLRSDGRFDDASKVLQDAALVVERSGDPLAASGLFLERGMLLREHLGDPVGAEQAFKAAISACPANGPAHAALIDLYQDQGRWDSLDEVLTTAARMSGEPEAKAGFYVRLGELLTGRLGRLDEGLAAFDKAEEARPALAACRQARVAALRYAQRPSLLADALAARRKADPLELSQDEVLLSYREEAELRAFQTGELERARELLVEALELRPKDATTLRSLLRVERQLGLGRPLAEHLDQASRLEADGGRRAALLVEAGRVYKTREGDLALAKRMLGRALKADPHQVEAVRWMATIAREEGSSGEVATWLEAEAELETDPKRRAELRTRLGKLQGRIKPQAAREAYERALEDDPDQLHALRGLAPILRRADAWPELAQVLSRLADLEPDRRTRVARLVALGDLYLQVLHEPAEARGAFDKALALEPEQLRALRGRSRTFAADEDPAGMVKALQAELERTPLAERRVALGRRIAGLRMERLKDVEGAVEALEEVLRQRPLDAEAWKMLRELHVQRQDFAALAAAYEREGRHTPDVSRQEECFRAAAQIHHHHLDDMKQAAALYEEVLARGDPEVLAVRELPLLLLQQGDEEAYERVLRRTPAIVPRTRVAAEAFLTLGTRAEERGELGVAVRQFEAALVEKPDSTRALDKLVALHRAQDEVPLLVRALRRKRALLGSDPAAIDVQLEVATLQEERLHDPHGAIEELQAADALAEELADERRPDVLRRLRQLCRRCGRLAELNEATSALADLSDDAEGGALLRERAEVERDEQGNARAAIGSLQAAFARSGELATLAPLIELLEQEELFEELAMALEDQARLTEEPATQAKVHARAAGILDGKLGRPEDAVAAWERVLELVPANQAAYEALREVCERTGDTRSHARALERRLSLLKESGEPAEVAEELAEVALAAADLHEGARLEQRAAAVLEQARQALPLEPRVFARLCARLEADKQFPRLYEVLRDRAQAVGDVEERATLHERLAGLAREELSDPETERSHWRAVLEVRPGHPEAVEALKRSYAEVADWESLAAVMRGEVLDREERAREGEAGGEELADLYLALGSVLEGKLDRPEEAIEAYAAAAPHAPGDPRPLRGLERIHEAAGRWSDLVRVRQDLRDQESDPPARAQLALAIADAYDQLDDRASATTAVTEALEEVPDDVDVLGRLRRYLVEAERYDEAVKILAREADAVPERATEYARRVERATILRDHLERPDEAIEALERARGLAPRSTEPLLALAALYEGKGDRPKQVEVLEARARLEEDDALAADLYAQAGQLNQGEGGDAAAACESFERALRRDPLRPEPLEALAALYGAQERWDEQARAWRRRAELARAMDAETAPWLLQVAKVEEDRLSSQSRAAATLDALLEDDPKHAGALEELARLRAALEEHAAHQEALGRQAALAEGPERRALLLRRAETLAERLGRPAAAAGCVRQALLELAESQPDDGGEVRRLAGRLMELEEAAGSAAGVLAAAELALQHAQGEEDGEELLRRIGVLASGPAYAPDRAIEVYAELYGRSPGEAAVLEALEGLYKREGRPGDLADLFAQEGDRLAEASAPAEGQVQAKFREAELRRTVLHQPSRAVARYREILALDPDQDRARDGLEAIFRAERQLPELAELLAERAERASEDGVAAQALSEEARVHEERGELELALDRLEAALVRAQGEGVSRALRGRVLRALVRLYRRRQRFEPLAKALQALADEPGQSGEERSDVLGELGVILARDLDRPVEATEAFERALTEDPENVPAARALAAVYLREERWEQLAEVYEKEAAAKVDDGRLLWLKNRLGGLRHQLGDQGGARDAYRQALALDPTSLIALQGLAAVTRELEDPRQLAPVLARLAEHAPSPVDRLEARRELAVLYEERLEDVGRAVTSYGQVLAEAPDDLSALRGLSRGLRQQGDKGRLVEAVEQELRLVHDDARRRELTGEAARLREELADTEGASEGRRAQLEKALAHAQAAGRLAPTETEPVADYARIAEKLGRWKELADATVAMARSVDDASRCGWMLRRAAKIRSLRLGDTRGAAEAFLEAVKVNAGDEEAWEALEPLARELGDDKLLLRALERRLQLTKGAAKKGEVSLKLGLQRIRLKQLPQAIDALVAAREHGRGPVRARALEQLEVAYRAAERWAELVDVLGSRASQGGLRGVRELLMEQARVYEQRLGLHERALEVLWTVREQDPADGEATRELERLLSKVGRWTDLVELYEAEARRLGRGGYDSLILLGRVARDQLDDPELAASALQRAVTLNPAGLDALEALKTLYARTEKWSELLDTLRLEIGLLKDAKTKVNRLRYAGQLAEEKLGDLTTAERFFRDAAALSDRDMGLLVSLGRVQEARGEHQGLADTLARQLSLEKRPAERLQLLKRRGAVLAEKLYRPFDAMDVYRQALEIEALDPESLASLTHLLRTQHEWAELITILTRRLKLSSGPAQVAIQLELALVQAHKLNRPEAALTSAQAALAKDPRCREAVLLQVEVYRTWGAERGQHAELAKALQALADLSQGAERAELLVELGDLFHDVLRNGAGALKAYQEALRADPSCEPALDGLAPLLQAAGKWDELLNAYESAARASVGFRCGELLTSSAEVLHEQKGDGAGAERRYREALSFAPNHLPALRGLARLLAGGGAGNGGAERTASEELVRLLLGLGKLEQDPAAQALAYVRAGDVYRNVLSAYPQARRCYELALERNPEQAATLASLAEMAFGAGDEAAALPLLTQVASAPARLGDPAREAELLWARGACLERAGQQAQAIAAYRQVLERRPGHLQALEDLARLLILEREWRGARPVIEELVRRTRPPRVRASHTLALARACAELGEEEQALSLYREGLKVLPLRAEARMALAGLLKERDPTEARKHYEHLVAAPNEEGGPTAAQRAEARSELATLSELVFKEPDRAAGHLRAAIDLPGPHRARACRHLAEILGRAGRWGDALHHLAAAVGYEADAKAIGELHASMARVLRDRIKDPKLAQRCFQKSLDFDPHDRKTLESLMRLLEAAGDMDSQVRTLAMAAAEAGSGVTGDEAVLRVRLAEVLLRQDKAGPAAQEYERVLILDPKHSGARTALAKLYLQLGDVSGVERTHRRMLEADPLDVGAYQALAQAWGEGRRSDAAHQAVQVLSALGAVRTAAERAIAKTFGDRMPRTKVQVKEDAFASTLVHEDARGALLELFRKAGHVLARQIPDDLKQHGIGWRTSRYGIDGDAFPEHGLLKKICDLIGLTSLDVYWMPDWKNPEPVIGHAKGSPALILCPEVFHGLKEAEKAFVLGRALGAVRLRTELFLTLSEHDTKLVVLGALKAFDPSQRSFLGEDEKLARAATKAMARATDVHPGLETTQRSLWRRRDAIDWAAFRQGVQLTGSRTGLFVAGGMHSAAQAVAATNMSLRGRIPESTQGVVKLFREIPELKDLCAFAVSEPYLRLREASLRTT
jgi:tetratricopeptide (TPR) repeat protein